jgi:hypothetical protein
MTSDHATEQHHHDTGHDQARGLSAMAASATLHCLTGCAIGEVAGLMIGAAAGFSAGATIALSIALAFVFGYTLSTLPLVRAGLSVAAALGVVLAADTLSIATMEVVDNLVMTLVPGAMDAGLGDVVFWFGMMIALVAAFGAAFPVNRFLLRRGKGHALTHEYHGGGPVTGARRFVPALSTPVLATAVGAFLLGGLVSATSGGPQDGSDGGDPHDAVPLTSEVRG